MNLRLAAPLLIALALGATACSFPNRPYDLRVRDDIPCGGEAFSMALYQSTGVEMSEGNEVELVSNGRVFDVLEDDILHAKQSINIVVFIWRPSEPSERLIHAIQQVTPRGVKCRVLVDPMGSVNFSSAHLALADAGCDVRFFHPMEPVARPLALQLRNHRKIVVVDGETALTGGFGIWKSWLGDGKKLEEWRDTNAQVRGPAVRQMQRAFAENWQEAGGGLLPKEDFPDLKPQGDARAAFVASTEKSSLSSAERMLLLTIAAAKKRIWIANSYFIPSTAIGDMLLQKAKEGVDVRVLASGKVHDWRMVRAAQRSTYERLLEGGIKIWEYQPTMMHSKTLLIDDRLVVVGSINLDPLSLKKMEEGSLVVESPELAAQLEKDWAEDIKHSIEIRKDSYMVRDVVDRLARQFVSAIGGFL